MRVSPDNSLTPQLGLVILAVVAIMTGLAARLTDQWSDAQTACSPKDGNCVYQVTDEDGCVGTVSMPDSGGVVDILSALGVADSPRWADNETKIPCGSRIRITRTPPAVSVEKLPGASLVAMGKRINLYNADQTDLAAIPGIGPQLAARIVSERDSGRPLPPAFKLQGVQGIGPKKRRALESYIEAGPFGPSDAQQNVHAGGNR